MSTDTSFAFSAGPDQQALRTAFQHFLRPTFTLLRGGGLAMLLVGLALVLLWDQYVAGLLVLMLGLGFAVVVPSRTLRRVMQRSAALSGRGASYRVDEQGIFAANDLVEALYRWPALTRVDELPGMLLVAIGESGFVSMRTGDLDPQTRAALTEFVRARVGRA
ncbi:hypothetical protein GCM10010168_08270 [Actinoplanes ianthinogenes]|uniref:YcxB-like protein domain-containing protein n=1 Tax=Actinoplanes ianthinogenes TaxID=122358 RepID=A0ABM7LSW1_9ACTN|nr:YcxB family protein [Actinoplanes ianthinogenes]BCJ42431.1 hypothetical protein Aiant_30880 [Actinoplanes ianthinogenes]GGQ94711.1 hypothetical protein GCM10010168_08270 [Actinoplanes ianthinogenes]